MSENLTLNQLVQARKQQQQLQSQLAPQTPLSQRHVFSDSLGNMTPLPGPNSMPFSIGSNNFEGGSSNPFATGSWQSQSFSESMYGSGGSAAGNSARSANGEMASFIGSAQAVSMDVTRAFIDKLKSVSNLSDDGNEALETYFQAPTLAERLGIQYASTLSIKLMLSRMVEEKEMNWAVSSDLKKIVIKYVKAYLLSSMTKSYIHCAPERLIISALRVGRVRELPSEDDITANATLKSHIQRAFVTARSQIKNHILATTQYAPKSRVPEDEQDLGTVVETLIGGSSDIPISLALMHRVAVMRAVIDTQSQVIGNAEKFWPLVDAQMASLLGVSETKTKQDIISYDALILILSSSKSFNISRDFHIVYEMDVEKYGKPRTKPIDVSDPKYSWTSYVKKINELASKIPLIDNGGKATWGKKRKRGRADMGLVRNKPGTGSEGNDDDINDNDIDEVANGVGSVDNESDPQPGV
ncbi:hypothetical protein DFJ43DRAFT_1215975 [Lentinula guzmanii]|uniref:Uncharacterized protein n=1 Tax=Lentinula guzmanii TaxID=2804957 RepID=A0AA38MQQ2_9AGAR|nr:hypothetical protein DFJ43DRAFT_1215975 [Lentinula guzmanii]